MNPGSLAPTGADRIKRNAPTTPVKGAAAHNESLNLQAARIFSECADVLRLQKANPFRVNAYLRASKTLRSLTTDVGDILEQQGVDGLMELPGIGKGLAAAIEEIARTGKLTQLERLRGESAPETLFQNVPGIGPMLAHAIHDALHVETLEALEVAAHDGRLEDVEGIGPRRVASIRASLAEILHRGRHYQRPALDEPPVATLLAVDRDYRRLAAAEKLPKIAPKRFNPEGRAWLPVLHTERDGWHFTALYSNTARAHELGRTDDWVVIYYYNDDHQEGQNTVVTETHGPLQGKRVVRGREREMR